MFDTHRSRLPATFGSLPFPSDLYFDQGEPLDGDGTLLTQDQNEKIKTLKDSDGVKLTCNP